MKSFEAFSAPAACASSELRMLILKAARLSSGIGSENPGAGDPKLHLQVLVRQTGRCRHPVLGLRLIVHVELGAPPLSWGHARLGSTIRSRHARLASSQSEAGGYQSMACPAAGATLYSFRIVA